MQVKVFEAEDMASSLKKVKEALGPDALIFSTRTVRKRGLGLLAKPMVEITAAIEAPAPTSSIPSPAPASTPAPHRTMNVSYDEVRQHNDEIGPLVSEVLKIKEQLATSDLPSIRKDLDVLKSLFQNFTTEMAGISKMLSTRLPSLPNLFDYKNAWLVPVTNELTNCGIRAEVADTILRLAKERLTPREVDSPDTLDVFFQQTIADLLQVNDSLLHSATGPKRVALIGPTGVGKTTTIAKLAAAYLKNYGKELALVTIDTYRIAAVEQLKVYGEIMKLPVEVVMAPEQLQDVLHRHEDKKLILIDTAGRSPRDEKSIEELTSFLAPDLGIENHLVLAATAREQELSETIKRFRHLSLKSFIFTKLDECETLGALLNVHARDNYPFSYLTNGQRVPEDLMLADSKKIAGLIMGKQSLQRNTNAFST